MTKYFYRFMELLMFKIHNWWHKDIYNYYVVFHEMCFDKDVFKHQEEMDNFHVNTLKKTPQEMKRYKNVQLTMMYHHSVERIVEKAKRVLENDPSEINKQLWEKDLKDPQEYWEYVGVNYFNNTLTDRIRRYFQWTCMPVPSQLRKKNRQDKNFISRHWINVCDLIERSQAFFSRY